MPDLTPMQRCPTGRKGRHRLTVIVPEGSDTTLVCRCCGALRRFSYSGPLVERLDDLSADEIWQAARSAR